MRAHRLVPPVAFLLAVGFAAPANAVVSVSGDVVTSDAVGDSFWVSCTGGVLAASGSATTGDSCATMTSLRVSPGGGADTVDLAGVTAAAFPALVTTNVYASDGSADTVAGSPLDDVITGDDYDTIDGAAGNDQLTGGASVNGGLGDDSIIEFTGPGLAAGGPGDDRFVQFIPQGGIEGGSGFDSWDVDFDLSSPRAGLDLLVSLTADLVQIRLGPAEFTKPVGGVEQAYWTLLRGDVQVFDASAFPGVANVRGLGGVDTLIGGASDDALHGGGGNDTITGNLGADVLHGGDDNDVIQARDGVADRVDCGAGTDSVVADAVDVVLNCENVDQPALPAQPTPAPVIVPGQTQLVPVVPVTGAVSGPAKVKKGSTGKFKFSSTTAGATFQCQLDDGPWRTCASTYKVKTKKLEVGKHSLLVRALLSGAADATPSRKRFKVRKG